MLSTITGLPGYSCGWMGKDCGSWVHQQCPHHQAPNLYGTSFVPESAWPKALPDCATVNPTRLVSNETTLGYNGYKLPQLKTGLVNVPQGWFYGLPRYRQALTPIPDCAVKEVNSYAEGFKRDVTVNAVSRPIEKKFLVFDHSGNQTRLIFSPGTAHPNERSNLGNPRALLNGDPRTLDNGGLKTEEWRTKTCPLYEAAPICSDGLDEKQEIGEESEMHENTEELNALLYSDDEFDCHYDEEEISTGHSPSKMTGHIKPGENAIEEVASSGGGHLKRKRLLVEECGTSSLMDTASSGKPNGSSEYQDDAESSCGESTTHGNELGSFSVNKRLKREKICETVNILQNIIPGGKGKDAIFVLDEAIQYLRSLKLRAQSLGECLD